MKKKYLLFILLISTISAFAETHYVDGVTGSDSNSGQSPALAWKSLLKVNSMAVSGGDTVLFKRGDVFRGNMIPVSGSSGNSTVYGAYGAGEKPKIFGSLQKNSEADWENIRSNIWQLKQNINPSATEILANPDFSSSLNSWSEWHNTAVGASSNLSRTTEPGTFFSAPAAAKLSCIDNGLSVSDIQFWTADYAVTQPWYSLTFKAKATKQFSFSSNSISLFKNSAPYTQYATSIPQTYVIDTAWNSYEVMLRSVENAPGGARICFMVGGVIPDSCDLYFDSLSFRSLNGDPVLLMNDVGNLILNNESHCGQKVKTESELNSQGRFWYDVNQHNIKIFSSLNPARFYSNIEIALTKDIIGQGSRSYVTYENLDLRYGSAHGIGGGNTHHIIIKDLDISFIGGGYLPGFGDGFVRYGNGVEFWNGAHDNVVERCTFDQIYDAALTAQGIDSNGYEVYNVIFRNNIIMNSEFSYELWARGPKSHMHHVYFENNTCLNAGFGWGHAQRPDPNGTHIICWGFLAQSNDVYVRNNIFYESSDYGSRWLNSFELEKVILDNNCWYESIGPVSRIINTNYDFATEWDNYKSVSKQDSHSIAADPMLNIDFTLKPKSLCIDTGYFSPVVSADFYGNLRPQGRKYDIGAYEFTLSSQAANQKQQTKYKVTAYPNPFNPSVRISFNGSKDLKSIEIVSLYGQIIRIYAKNDFHNEAFLYWNGRDNAGRHVASGIYYIKLNYSDKVFTKSVILKR